MWAYPWSSSLTHSDFSMQRRETSRLHQEARLSATEWRGVPSLTGISGSARRSAQSGGDQSHPPNRASESVGRCVGGQLDREALLEQRTRTSQTRQRGNVLFCGLCHSGKWIVRERVGWQAIDQHTVAIGRAAGREEGGQ